MHTVDNEAMPNIKTMIKTDNKATTHPLKNSDFSLLTKGDINPKGIKQWSFHTDSNHSKKTMISTSTP